MSRKVLIIVPSIIAARGLESIFSDLGEFQVAGILRDLSATSQNRLRNVDADAIIIDPAVFDFEGRRHARAHLSEYTDAAALAFQSGLCEENVLKQFDEVIGLYDDPTAVIRKVRSAISAADTDAPRSEGEELSTREKEILVEVAQGRLNKEIADKFNISIYTVITHRKNITRKTGIKTVAGLTVYALLNNLLDINSLE